MKHALIQLLSNSQSTCFCLRNKKTCTVFLQSYRNMSGSLGEQEMETLLVKKVPLIPTLKHCILF